MRCWWMFFHNWAGWSKPVQRTWESGGNGVHPFKVNQGLIQTNECTKCGKFKWRIC